MCTGDNNSVNTDHGDEKIFCLYTNNISILAYWVVFFFLLKVAIKKETFMANHGSFPQDFHKEFSEHDVFHKVQRSSVWAHELLLILSEI